MVRQIESASSSFDAVVWRANNANGTPNPSGKLYVSMRGTQQMTDFLIDAQLALTGNAGQQVIDMINWWQRITAPAGLVTQTRYARDAISEDWSFSTDSANGEGVLSAADLAAGVECLQLLEQFPFSCRKAADGQHGPRLREMLIPFGAAGYVALFEIEDARTVTILAVRHQRESDYY